MYFYDNLQVRTILLSQSRFTISSSIHSGPSIFIFYVYCAHVCVCVGVFVSLSQVLQGRISVDQLVEDEQSNPLKSLTKMN